MLRKLRRLADLSPGEWVLLLQLAVLSLALGLGLRLVPLSRLTTFLARWAESSPLQRLRFLHRTHEASRLANLADMAAVLIPGHGRCLMRSLLLFWLLKVRAEPVVLLIGVCKDASALLAHAWVELEERVIGDEARITGRYAPLLRI